MWKSAKSKAEAQFATPRKKTSQVLQDLERERQERDAHAAKLKGLRLAKEAADKQAAEEAAEAAKEGSAKRKKSRRLPRAHRSPS